MLRVIKWIVLFLPALIWLLARQYHDIWWAENLTSIPALILFVYFSLALVLFVFRRWAKALTSIVISGAFFPFLLPTQITNNQTCENPLTIVQFNLFYENPDINQFINYLLKHPADLVVMQELSPQVGEKLHLLDDIYPFYYGGQRGVGYPSNQMILSRYLLEPVSIYHTPDGQEVIRATWQVDNPITLMTAHPPSPRTEPLWQRRNALIRTIETLTDLYPTSEMIVIGDFNLSAASPRFSKLFSRFQSRPVASWPTSVKGLPVPAFAMIGIDHLWFKSEYKGRKICTRLSTSQPNGSDHRLVTTVIGNVLN
ncbi:endonuclease [Vibrio rotiferianus]|uniref:endonuclease/exonuclease/phosphatase family protein n=1 Tax=Vibrio rotiferianus TaxID=190895 RepID=UPI001110E1BD|nr:endonuclease/exonuclease/phosphatase family protein [Vibrio rotiferianus]TMX39323.1 endonuclease [Vibrio rotiferianus]TMX50513.1 endonuclease [Vibrio rotiferianus]TMX68084.1 endonuclease [Vibrio rotiferianus]